MFWKIVPRREFKFPLEQMEREGFRVNVSIQEFLTQGSFSKRLEVHTYTVRDHLIGKMEVFGTSVMYYQWTGFDKDRMMLENP